MNNQTLTKSHLDTKKKEEIMESSEEEYQGCEEFGYCLGCESGIDNPGAHTCIDEPIFDWEEDQKDSQDSKKCFFCGTKFKCDNVKRYICPCGDRYYCSKKCQILTDSHGFWKRYEEVLTAEKIGHYDPVQQWEVYKTSILGHIPPRKIM